MAGNGDSHDDFKGRSTAVFVVTTITVAICTIVVFFRILSRAAIVKRIWWDDYFIIVAWVLAVGLSTSICIGAAYGLGRHEVNIPPAWQSGLRRSIFAFSVLYQPALMATKTSILVFYLNFSAVDRTFRWACYVTMFVVNAGGFALTMVTIFQCSPVSAVFRLTTPTNAKCTDILTIYLASIPLNIITDLTLLFLPMPILTGIHLPRKQKIIVLVTFSFGIFVAVVDVVRISYLQSASMTRLLELQSFMPTDDSTRDAENVDSSHYLAFSFMWSAIEVTVGIMVACVPGLKPLVARFVPNLLRDPEDPPSRFGSVSHPNPEVERAAPSLPDDVNHVDLRTGSQEADDAPMDMTEFLTGRRDFAQQGNNNNETPESAVDFLTTPETAAFSMSPMVRSSTAVTNTTRHTNVPAPTFFEFANVNKRKSLVHLTNRESIYPIAVVTVLFFVWGFEYGLLDVLNRQFQTVAKVTTGQALGIRSAYYCGYFFGPLSIGRLILKHWGFKACFPIGLSIYAAGGLIFWPAAVLTSWPTFIVTNFIVGFGLSILEVSANPFIVLCGPAEYAESRLNFSQGVQAIGGIIAPLIVHKAIFDKTSDTTSLVNTQWAYLGIALATAALALVYYYVPLPEATDAELEDAAERMDGANKAKVGKVSVIWLILGMGIFSQFCYVGAQEIVGISFGNYLRDTAPTFNEIDFDAIAHTAFAVGRFLAAGLGFWVRPRLMLLCFYCGAILLSALCTHFTGSASVALIVLLFFCEGPLFSLIFAQALRGQGKHTKFASVLITSGICGGVVFSPIATTVADSGRGVAYSFVVAVAVFAGGTLFALGLNADSRVRKIVDPIKDVTVRDEESRPSSASSRTGRALSLLDIVKKRKRESGGTEYREKKGVES